MKRIVSALLLVTLMFTTLACLTSCGAEDNGAQISVYLSDRVYGFDPAGDGVDDDAISVMYLLYEPLFSLDDDGDVHKAMADDYYFDKETGDLYITLRESYWSNGSRVTADDFVYSWKRLIDSKNSFTAASLLYDVKNAIAIKTASATAESQSNIDAFGVTALNTTTLRIQFASADVNRDAFLRNLTNIALAPVSRDSIEGQETFWSNGASATCYTNGPFKIKELDSVAGYFTLVRNDGYHRPEESKKDVDYFVLPELLRTAWNIDDSKTNTAHIEALYDLVSTKAENTVFYMGELSLADRKEAVKKAEVSDALSTYSYIFDTSNPLFADSRVRTILSKVIDRTVIADLVTFGVPATGLVSNGVWDSVSARARKSFRRAGGDLISANAELTISDAKAQLNALSAQTGSFTLTYQDKEEDIAIAAYVANLWTQLGYTVRLNPVSYYVIAQDTGGMDSSGNKLYTYYHTSALQQIFDRSTVTDQTTNVSETLSFDVIAIDYQMYSTNALSALSQLSTTLSGCGVDIKAYNESTATDKKISDFICANMANYANAEYNNLIVTAATTADLKARATLLHQAEQILMNDMPVIPILFNQNFYVVNKNLKKLDINYYGFTVFTEAKLKSYKKYFLTE